MDSFLVKKRITVKNEKYEAIYTMTDVGENLDINIINDRCYKSIPIIQVPNPDIKLLTNIFNQLKKEDEKHE